MNIKQAKNQIKNAMLAYFTKDEYGRYRIPIEKQRPVFLYGPPGIGKTAIMEQVAAELNVGLVSYSMTHHTRQSALGLPYIVKKKFEGVEFSVSEYTMSEIIGSVYDLMRDTGVREGILFLDEINCVSETLAPCMLQFLQYKIFGQHRIPEGWIVVTAGNPPEYNKSVRDFDIVTWDRLKRIDVEPDYDAWKEYATERGVHAVVMTYIAIRRRDFYVIENSPEGKRFVTARGWDDLSEMIKLYEENKLEVDGELIGQYLQNKKIARDFALYYDLYQKYHSDYQIDKILAGQAPESIVLRARMAPFDERLSLLSLLFDAVHTDIRTAIEKEEVFVQLRGTLKDLPQEATEELMRSAITQKSKKLQEVLEKGQRSSSISGAKQRVYRQVMSNLDRYSAEMSKTDIAEGHSCFEAVKKCYSDDIEKFDGEVDGIKTKLQNVFTYYEAVDPESDDLLLLVTELAANYQCARFIGHYGCESFSRHSDDLKFNERQKDIQTRLAEMEWEVE